MSYYTCIVSLFSGFLALTPKTSAIWRGSAWARPREFTPRANDYLKSERNYIDWVGQTKAPVVDILIGDSGRGISSVLADKYRDAQREGTELPTEAKDEEGNVLLWAFDRWSSSRDAGNLRGTRGLYRVDRVVRKYQGLITARSANQQVGWDHGGLAYDSVIVEDGRKLAIVPGTLIRLRLPAFREVQPSWRTVDRTPKELKFVSLRLQGIGPEGLSEDVRDTLRRVLDTRLDKPRCIVAAITGQLFDPKGIEEIVKQAVEIRHPATLILGGLPGGWDAIEVAVNSINAEHSKRARSQEAYDKQHFQIWDPVLIIGEMGQFA